MKTPGKDWSEFWKDVFDTLQQQNEGSKAPNDSVDGMINWDVPDMDILHLRRRLPPGFPLDVLGDHWGDWVVGAATGASCPVDYVVGALLASASGLIGHGPWAQAAPGWREPPHLWMTSVGDSGDGKSPGADCLMRDVLPENRAPNDRRLSPRGSRTSRKNCARVGRSSTRSGRRCHEPRG